MPVLSYIIQQAFNPSSSSSGFFQQWANPSDVFSVLLILGGDVVARALAQLAGSRITPVAFSFGWVSYAIMAVVHAFGENKLMPAADCACKVINGHNGFVRDNSSWIISRIMRDFETWKDDGPANRPAIQTHIGELLKHEKNSRKIIEQSNRAGLRISIYKAGNAQPGYPGHDWVYFAGFATVIAQLGLAAIPCGLYGHWAILVVTIAGIILSFATGALPQWTREKWACRRNAAKTVILTRGNGSQHAIVILGTGNGLDLEDLATAGSMSFPSCLTRCATVILAALWILLLITAAGIQENTWYLLAIGSIGMLDNIYVAGASRSPKNFGIPLQFVEVIGHNKVMKALLEVESRYPRVGRSMLRTFFPGDLEPEEQVEWDKYSKLTKE
ncbi:hypothetical protein FHL15_008840 [Xylaria flabelliformis]|uniref:Uncharacterized protein n=1 Tax=Xylaria flabelliformis TaxID=2512241 RepID=A0A553HQR2_9PEZI|nr:hypothetical protein FHL15_008840 [Xylaria flabelliformis]